VADRAGDQNRATDGGSSGEQSRLDPKGTQSTKPGMDVRDLPDGHSSQPA